MHRPKSSATTPLDKKVNDTTFEIVELPINNWTQIYKVELEAMIGEKCNGSFNVCVPICGDVD